MTFGQAISTCFRKFVTFRGRAPRSEYWYFYLFGILVGMGAGIVDGVISVGGHSPVQPLGALVTIVLLLPRLSVAVRRLHDVNYSGWFLGGFFIVIALFAAAAIAMMMTNGHLDPKPTFSGPLIGVLIAGGVTMFVWGIWAFVLTVIKGTSGPNKYGEDPLGPNVEVFN